MEGLAFASLQVRNSKNAAITDENGSYRLEMEKGVQELVVTMIGYHPLLVKIVIDKPQTEHNIVLQLMENSLVPITIKGKSKDQAEELLRTLIRKKDSLKAASGAFSVDVYIKAVQEDSLRRRQQKRSSPANTDSTHADLQGMALSEISLRLDYRPPRQYREERTGVANRGVVNRLFYLSTTEGIFDLYDNLIKVPALSPISFVSPVSFSGLLAYKYKTLHIEKKGGHNKITIQFKPGTLSNATLTGELVIDDSAWVLLETNYSFPVYHLPEYDFFKVYQTYEFVNRTALMITQQKFEYYSKSKRGKASGYTEVVYKNFELNKNFPKNYFGSEKSVATGSTYNRDSLYWNQVRTEPLTDKEMRFVRYKDSIYAQVHSKAYLDSIDRKQNTVTWQKLLYQGQPVSRHEKGRVLTLPSIAAMSVPYLFSFGGVRIGLPISFNATHPQTKKSISVFAQTSYGLLNKDLNWSVSMRRKYNAFNQGYFTLTSERDFARIFTGDAIINQLKRNNYYLNNGFGVGWGREIANGFMVNIKMDMALRRSLAGYKTYRFMDSVFKNDPGGSVNKPIEFSPFNALYGSLELRYTPFQPYIREPNEKIVLDGKWPTAYLLLRKGIPTVFNSKAQFDYLELGLQQTVRLGTAGISSYTVKSGSFINKKQLNVVDYKWLRRGDPYLFLNPKEAFQALDSTFSIFKRFYEAHYLHEFNGAVLNKIPLLKKIGLREVAGAGFLLAKERQLNYVEAFVGVERVFKVPFQFLQKFKLGFYVVGSLANQFKNPVQFKIGFTTWDSRAARWR